MRYSLKGTGKGVPGGERAFCEEVSRWGKA